MLPTIKANRQFRYEHVNKSIEVTTGIFHLTRPPKIRIFQWQYIAVSFRSRSLSFRSRSLIFQNDTYYCTVVKLYNFYCAVSYYVLLHCKLYNSCVRSYYTRSIVLRCLAFVNHLQLQVLIVGFLRNWFCYEQIQPCDEFTLDCSSSSFDKVRAWLDIMSIRKHLFSKAFNYFTSINKVFRHRIVCITEKEYKFLKQPNHSFSVRQLDCETLCEMEMSCVNCKDLRCNNETVNVYWF